MPSGSIHNFRHFIDFPDVFSAQKTVKLKPFHHPLLENAKTVTSLIFKRDILLHFPYHSFDAIIDLLREAAIDPQVTEIKITAYRLASQSKIINALINAKKNGKSVTVVLELKARFDEEANLEWKQKLEDENIKVHIGIPQIKVHAKICLIKKVTKGTTVHYGFISTGNINEKTASIYSDTCLLTCNRQIMADINRVFNYLTSNKRNPLQLNACKKIVVSPVSMRRTIIQNINNEIQHHKQKKSSGIILKLNSLSDTIIIKKLVEAAEKGVKVQLIIRSIFCAPVNKKLSQKIASISIIDSFLEHSRVMYFNNAGKELMYISSADFMTRNLDFRIEVAAPIEDELLKRELFDFLQLQLRDNTKARIFNFQMKNEYVSNDTKAKHRSQFDIYQYLFKKTLRQI
jgi:polyphosphate kinase